MNQGIVGQSPAARSIYCLLLLSLLLGCSQAPPRSREEIIQERESLPRLYLTQKSNKEVAAPGDKGAFVDPESGEMCWPAQACYSPECPGRAGSRPFIFSSYRDAPRKPKNSRDAATAGCPQCDEAGLAPAPGMIRPYVLPEVESRLRELDDELRRRAELDEIRL